MKDIITALLKKEVKNNFDDLTDEFIEELIVLSYNSDIHLGEKIYGEMQSKIDDEDLVDELIGCLEKIKDLAPFKQYLKFHTDYLRDEAETLCWLFCNRDDKDEALFWLNQIEDEDDSIKAKQYYEAFFSTEELCEKIINKTEQLHFKYSHTIIDKVIKQNNQVITTILKQLKTSNDEAERHTIAYSLLTFADNNSGLEVDNILDKLLNYNLSTDNKLFLTNVFFKKDKIETAKALYQQEFQNCINNVIEDKGFL